MNETYKRKDGIREQKVGAELMLVDEATDKVHVLNLTSSFVWTCLQETFDLDAIALKLAETFDAGDKDVRAVASKALAQLVEKGVVARVSL